MLRDLRRNTDGSADEFPHPTPQLNGAKKELIRYKRADGVTSARRCICRPATIPRKTAGCRC